MTSTEQLERETEQTRSQIADTLEELRACMTPGRMVNQLADRVGDAGGREFLQNLKRQTVDNPVPVAMIGAGLAWLMLGGRDRSGSAGRNAGRRLGDAASAAADNMSDTADAAASAAGEARERVGQAADRARQSASSAAEAAGEMAGSFTDSVQRSASTSYEAMSDSARKAASAAADSARAARQRTREATNALVDFCREQPLVLAGLGLAIGATLGALLPQTEAEDRLLGEGSDALKQRAQDVASEQYEAAKKVGERALDTAQEEAARQGGERTHAASHDASPGASAADEATLVPPEHPEHQPQGAGLGPDHAHP
jgi:ElaB/YqjD/DUF883 family membrane-anchored ribosome-binding protein